MPVIGPPDTTTRNRSRARWDVAVVGLGPAGRALAHRLVAAGLSVLALDPAPERPWTQTLGGWLPQLPCWLPADVVGAVADDPVIRTDRTYPIRARYAVLDNAALARALSIDGACVHERAVSDADLTELPAGVVIDARGNRPSEPDPQPHPRRVVTGRRRRQRSPGVPLQRAVGVLVEPARAAPVLEGSEAVLMDWRPYDGRPDWGRTFPTFLYAIPLPDGRVLLEETCLAGDPGPDHAALRARLIRRLSRYGITRGQLEEADVEVVTIPMRRPPRARTGALRFGAAGAQHNPITGYSVFASLQAIEPVVEEVVAARTGRRPRTASHPGLMRQAALRALLRLAPDDTMALFDAFGRLPASRQRDILDAQSTTLRLAIALTAQFSRLPPRSAAALVRATTFG